MRLLLDTNRYSDLARGEPDVVARVGMASELWLSVITLGELRTGFALGSKVHENERRFEEFISKPIADILLLDEETTKRYAEVFSQLKRQGTPIPTNDIWIAAQALQHDLTLDTRDQHFRYVPNLKLAEAVS